MEYPVYFHGKEIGKWNPLLTPLWNLIEPHTLNRYPYPTDYLCHLEKDRVFVSLKAGEGA